MYDNFCDWSVEGRVKKCIEESANKKYIYLYKYASIRNWVEKVLEIFYSHAVFKFDLISCSFDLKWFAQLVFTNEGCSHKKKKIRDCFIRTLYYYKKNVFL